MAETITLKSIREIAAKMKANDLAGLFECEICGRRETFIPLVGNKGVPICSSYCAERYSEELNG